jgi:ADP-ribose pyrophosphatase YjhB (NUDIX family)
MVVSKVFLGGTTAGPDWRPELISLLQCPFFNPVVKDWNEEARQQEVHEKKECGTSLYVLTPYLSGVFSIAEVVEDCISRRPGRTVLCVLRQYQGKDFENHMARSIDALIGLVKEHGCFITEDLQSTATVLNQLSQVDIIQDRYLYKTKWLSLKEMQGPTGPYVYSHEDRCNGHIVVVLPFRNAGDGGVEILARKEFTPPWGANALFLSSITGGVDAGEDSAAAAIRELQEETGYVVPIGNIISLGTCHGVKSCDTIYSIYAVDVTGLPGSGNTDAAQDLNEQMSKNVWMPPFNVVKAADPLLYVACARWQAIPESESISTFRW